MKGNERVNERRKEGVPRRRRYLRAFIYAGELFARVYIYFIAIFITFTKTLRETASLNILRCDRPALPRIRNARTTEVNRIQWGLL